VQNIVSNAANDERNRLALYRAIERKLLWLSCWMIDQSNRREKVDGIKVGGHRASAASMVSIMTALYWAVLRPEDRVAVKPHASPVFHALQYLAGNQTRQKLENFRGYGGAQSYPIRTKDVDDVDFSTGSVGLGVGVTAFASIVQDYVHARGWAAASQPKGRMVELVGDAELNESNVYECLGRRVGSTIFAIPGGSSITTVRAWMAWCAMASMSGSKRFSLPLAGTW